MWTAFSTNPLLLGYSGLDVFTTKFHFFEKFINSDELNGILSAISVLVMPWQQNIFFNFAITAVAVLFLIDLISSHFYQ